MQRCEGCQAETDDGAAFCQNCGLPFTAYGGQGAGYVSEHAVARAERMATRPGAVTAAVALVAYVTLAYPGRAIVGALAGRTRPNAEGTNYIGVAFGALNTVVVVVVMGLLAAGLAFLAWSTWTQRTWAWWGVAALLAVAGLTTLATFGGGPFVGLVRLAVLTALAVAWTRPRVREWYGV